jgi:hypothetical protein
MGYLIGFVLAVSVASFATLIGFDRERSFYPTVAIIVASYYALFGVIGGSERALGMEILVGLGFATLASVGYRRSVWLVCAALAGHGIFDFVHHLFIDNPGMPVWWPSFCGTFDVTAGAWFALLIWTRARRSRADG